MALIAGTKLGPYEIVALLGAGGMGEVYRAHDTKLGRDVALKLLPPRLAVDADRVSRLERDTGLITVFCSACVRAPPHSAPIAVASEPASVYQANTSVLVRPGTT